MNYNKGYKESHIGKTTVIAALCSFAAIILIIFLVIVFNLDIINKVKNSNSASQDENDTSFSEIKESNPTDGITVDDLSFFKHEEVNEETGPSKNNPSDPDENPEATDGKHTYITYADGTGEWVSITPYLAKNQYDFLNLACSNGKMKYYIDNKCVSFLGADISESDAYVDFNKLKKAGISFVMIKAGARGHEDGKITIDGYLSDNLKRATDAGLSIGLYFESLAITEKEAKTEAEAIIKEIGDYEIDYPIAYMMMGTEDGTSRTDKLSRSEKTAIVKAFCKAIKTKGFTPIIYGDKARLIKYYDLSKLGDYDVWLSQTDTDIPDYPYCFNIWQYNISGSIEGIAKDAHLNISFVDYASD